MAIRRTPQVLTGLLGLFALSLTNSYAQTRPNFVNGQAQIVAGFNTPSTWIKQELWVETNFDTDGDGKLDRVHVKVTRPYQTDTEGLKVATIYESSPYYSGTAAGTSYYWNANQELNSPPTARSHPAPIPFKSSNPDFANTLVSTWVPRGFAVVHSEAPGTGLSGGCPTLGGNAEEQAPKAVIDWLNGRAKGFSSKTGNSEIKATWSTGKVGMTGVSYNGTLALAAATTGVEGLTAIIPIAPNTSYYHYYRSNGLVRHPGGYLGEDVDVLYDYIASGDPLVRPYCEKNWRDDYITKNLNRHTGDYSAFWAERDLLNKLGSLKAAVLIAHGQQDFNVVPEHSIRIYRELRRSNKITQLYLHTGGHGGSPTLEMMNRWFTRFLYDVQNDVENSPKSYVVRENNSLVSYADFPHPQSQLVTLAPISGGNQIGKLDLTTATQSITEKLVDNPALTGSALVQQSNSTNRLVYALPEFTKMVHLSGTPKLRIKLASSRAATNLSAWLVTLPFDASAVGSGGVKGVLSRGWADPQNAEALIDGGNYSSTLSGKPLVPGQFVSLSFDMQPFDRQIAAGTRLALLIMASDRDFTLRPSAGTELSIDLNASSLLLPVVGGKPELQSALAQSSEQILSNCQPVSISTLNKGTWSYFKLAAPPALKTIRFETSGGTGDVDLYVRKSSRPSTSQFDCKSTGSSNTESCALANDFSSNYYVGLYAYSTSNQLSLKACAAN